jgi:hypothetical protein
MPPATSPAAYRPVTMLSAVSGSAHHVVTGRANLHRLLRDVDVGQLLELVVHRRQPSLDELLAAPGRDVEEDPAVR